MTHHQFKSLLLNLFIESHVDILPLHAAHTLDSTASCLEAIELMNTHKIGCVLVKKGTDALAGIFTERDVLNKLWGDERQLSMIQLHEVMTPSPQYLKYHASVAKAVYLMDVGGFRHVPVIAKDKSPAIISVTDFVHFIAHKVTRFFERRESNGAGTGQDDPLMEFFSGDLSLLRPSPPIFVHKDSPVSEAILTMKRNRTGSVIVGVPEKHLVQGIFTERDLVKKVIVARESCSQEAVETFMTRSPVTLQPTTSVMYAFGAMDERKFRHIPIVDFDERAIGMISSRNLIHFISTHIISEIQRGTI